MKPTDTLATSLSTIEQAPLDRIPPVHADRVRRRIVDNEALESRLDVAAFNSAP